MKGKGLLWSVVFALVFSIVFVGAVYSQDKFPFKSAIIKYKISGDMQNGEQELYIDDYGEKNCSIMDIAMTMGGFNTTTQNMTINNGNDFYNIDLSKKTGIKATIDKEQREKMKDIAKKIVPTPEEMEKSWNKVGTETILGKPCDIYEGEGMKAWLWKKVMLKTEFSMMGNYTMEAISLDIDVSIPNSRFEPPSDITITEQDLAIPEGFTPLEN